MNFDQQFVQRLIGAVALVFAAGAASYPFLKLSRQKRILPLLLLAITIFLAPLIVPLPHTGLRLIASLMSIMVGIKLYDLHNAVESGPPPRLWQFLIYLPNGFNMVFRRVTAEQPPPKRIDAFRLLWLVPTTLLFAAILFVVLRFDWQPYPVTAEHCVKVIFICLFVQFGSNIGSSSRRLLNIPATDFSAWFFLASTPAEFWRRWNRPAGQYLQQYIFMPTGGNRHPIRGILATFAFNGLFHEYVFDIPAGRILGYAMLFFLIQGIATAATMHLRPTGFVRVAGVALTLIFNLTTAWLFFMSLNAIIPFYTARAVRHLLVN